MNYDIRCNSSLPDTVAEGARRERERAASLWRNGSSAEGAPPLILTSSSATTSATNFRQKQSSLSVGAPGDFFFVFAEFRAVARTHNCREFTRRILRKSPKDAHPPWGDRESLKGLFWKTVLNPCLRLFTLTGSSLLWMIYTWSIWLRFVSNGQQMEARVKEETRGNGGNDFH